MGTITEPKKVPCFIISAALVGIVRLISKKKRG